MTFFFFLNYISALFLSRSLKFAPHNLSHTALLNVTYNTTQ